MQIFGSFPCRSAFTREIPAGAGFGGVGVLTWEESIVGGGHGFGAHGGGYVSVECGHIRHGGVLVVGRSRGAICGSVGAAIAC